MACNSHFILFFQYTFKASFTFNFWYVVFFFFLLLQCLVFVNIIFKLWPNNNTFDSSIWEDTSKWLLWCVNKTSFATSLTSEQCRGKQPYFSVLWWCFSVWCLVWSWCHLLHPLHQGWVLQQDFLRLCGPEQWRTSPFNNRTSAPSGDFKHFPYDSSDLRHPPYMLELTADWGHTGLKE